MFLKNTMKRFSYATITYGVVSASMALHLDFSTGKTWNMFAISQNGRYLDNLQALALSGIVVSKRDAVGMVWLLTCSSHWR